MAIDYLGHKRMLRRDIVHAAERYGGGLKREIADIFCGTAAVAGAFSQRGYSVAANDMLALCVAFAEATLLNRPVPRFSGLKGEIALPRGAEYARVLAYLNSLTPVEGFFTKEYSPIGPQGRKYFTAANAQKIDAIRHQLNLWRPALTRGEEALLRIDLVRAANAVANTAGTYGCYLKTFKSRALQPVILAASELPATATHDHFVSQADANALVKQLTTDIVYADPPYTKRQYAAYYHVLETLVVGDEPALIGSTGLRPWQDRASAYCYRRTATKALADLISGLRCRLFMLSYNEDGHISHDDIMQLLRSRGRVAVIEQVQKRYKSSTLPHKGDSVVERLYVLQVKD